MNTTKTHPQPCQHSPASVLPLRVGLKPFNITDHSGKIVVRCEEKDDASYIVHCVNHHDALVEALKKLMKHEPPQMYCGDAEAKDWNNARSLLASLSQPST